MGIHGPAPTPTNILKLRNSRLADRNPSEPKADVCIPPMPEYMKGIARDEWERVSPILLNRSCISNSDLAMFEAYCNTYAAYRTMAKHPKKYTVTEFDKTARLLMRLAAEFGLSPSSRSRISVEVSKEEKDPFDILDKGRAG